jgi:EAL domain-containing protein (putative c-di-GMP-specific phosphodiesterase class I)
MTDRSEAESDSDGPLADAAEDVRVADEERVRQLLRETSIYVVYQPIVNLDSEQVIGYEALTRFVDDPARSPSWWFIEAAELGILVPAELMAVDIALRDLKQLPPATFLALKVSPATMLSDKFRAAIAHVPGDRLLLDIAEHGSFEDLSAIGDEIEALRERGVRVQLEDAGSGFAGLQNLVSLQPDVIKIDIDVTRGIDQDETRQLIAFALRSLADRSGATVVAEGVETSAEVDMLRALGIHSAQGYLFGKPGPLPGG